MFTNFQNRKMATNGVAKPPIWLICCEDFAMMFPHSLAIWQSLGPRGGPERPKHNQKLTRKIEVNTYQIPTFPWSPALRGGAPWMGSLEDLEVRSPGEAPLGGGAHWMGPCETLSGPLERVPLEVGPLGWVPLAMGSLGWVPWRWGPLDGSL